MARIGLRYRQNLRAFRAQPAFVQLLSATVPVLLVAGGLAAVTHSGSGDSGRRISAPGVPGEIGPGVTSGGPGSPPDTAGNAAAGGSGSTPSASASGGAGATSGSSNGSGPTGPGPTTPAAVAAAAAKAKSLCGNPIGPGKLTASDRGVSATSIRIAFPYFDTTATEALTGTSQQTKKENQADFIQAYVDCINAAGGIGGRMIQPEVQVFNPLDENTMRALCLKWTQDDKVFAVIDSAAWAGQNQLCVTKENHTPLVSGWTTVSDYTTQGSPYLWWAAPNAEQSIDNLLLWGTQRGKLTSSMHIGVVTSDRPGDQLALKHMNAGLARLGLKPADEQTFTYDRSSAEAQATLAANKMKAKGVDVLLPLLAFDSFAFWLQAAENQAFYPHYLLSDYEEELVVAQALLGSNYPKSLQHAQGPTFAHLGEADFAPKYPPKYDASEARCEAIWQREHSQTTLQVAGVNMRWCDSINLFVEAARRTGPDLTRLRWSQAMATIHDFGGAMTPTLSYGPGQYAGPTQMRIVDTLTSNCPAYLNGTPCTVILEPYAPLRHF